MMKFEQLQKYCLDNHITYDEKTETLFGSFCEMLIEKNKVMNLTAVTEIPEIERIHFIDSLEAVPVIQERMPANARIMDIGTGAGFPGMPLAIVLSEIQFILADALNKRIDFLKEVIDQTRIPNVTAIQGRAEELGQSSYRENFDFCISRAVANMTVLLEYMLPLVKLGGYAILYKSGDYQEELEQAAYAMKILGGKLDAVRKFHLPGSDIARSLIIIKKSAETPAKYPRRPGKPSKSPLVKK